MANSESNSLQLSVKLPKGETIEIQWYSSHLVKSIHEKILMKSMIPVTEQKLYYQGIQLEREKKLEAYSIKDAACLELIIGCDDTSEPLQEIHQLSSKICRMCRDKSVSEDPNSDDIETIAKLLAPEAAEKSTILMISYSIPATLVMLYRSEIKQHQSHANDLIRRSMHQILNCPNDFDHRCITLALEFCVPLRDQASYEDTLYRSCRTTVKQLLDRGNLSVLNIEILSQILLFLYELAMSLGKGLYQMPGSESLKFHLSEFQAFSCVLRNAVFGKEYANEDNKHRIDFLSTEFKYILNDLLTKMEEHLSRLPELAEMFHTIGSFHSVKIAYLDILKELNSQLWEDYHDQFRLVLKTQQISLRLILEKTTRKDDYHWLLEHNDVIDAESRMHLVTMMMIPEEKFLDSEFYKPLIHWSRFLDEELFQAFKDKNLTSPKELQDWLYKLCQAIFKPQNLLFLSSPNDPTKFYPNPELKLEPLHLDCYEFSVAGRNISTEDVRDAYPSFYNNKAKEQFPDDDQIRNDFLNSISEQISFFKEGFDSVFAQSIVDLLSFKGIELEDVNLVLKGNLNLEFGEITHVTQCNNESDPLMSQFLKINRQGLDIKKSGWQMDRNKTLGGGISGNVYKGYADGGFFFAIKEIQIKNKAQLAKIQIQQEVNLLCQFSHPNIVKYYGTEEDQSKIYIFLELVSTGSLRQVYKSFQLKNSQVSRYTKQILEGLKYLHDRKVVHRDIKCANILVDEKGCVKITDFGLAKVTELVHLLKSCHGTIDWIAPEVMKKDKEYGVEADIWSLGCTVLEMLTRKYPYSHVSDFNANLEMEVQNGTLRNHLPNYSLSEKARSFIMDCLQVDPKKRPTASQLLNHSFVKDSFSFFTS
ncbi:E3 ubiquitin-protein ligase UPL5 isoform X2 [Manihot esculenta]|uniref:E3 ubiquitin-protein ligase UPL5 isoform X2 n=1 Tax=Manihot esculenta TaxID=3983 RepID=UPI000B5D7F6E|nr:E3 ubiquitin-protein ligase UPL5 isoform X2 [Manihot esculenta]